MTDFPGITEQARGIAKMYKFLGLWSIPILTIATTISIANVFMHGQLASDTRLQFTWAFLFAAAIEVNIVRLFFEWKVDSDRGAFALGIILALVAGVALIIEGLQQSIGFDWSLWYVQIVIGIVVAMRVIVVVLLLAREGSKLGMVATMPIDTPKETIAIRQIDTHPASIRMIAPRKNDTDYKVRAILKKDPGVSIRSLAKSVGVSPGTAQKYKNRIAQEA